MSRSSWKPRSRERTWFWNSSAMSRVKIPTSGKTGQKWGTHPELLPHASLYCSLSLSFDLFSSMNCLMSLAAPSRRFHCS